MGSIGDKFTNRELLDNILVLLIAGTDTTSTALGWVFYHLSKDLLSVSRYHT